MAAYFALLNQGDTAMGMSLAHGGHLTHGEKVSFSGSLYNFVRYGVSRETERIDYHEIETLALKHHPKLIVAGASAYPRIIDFECLRSIADRVDAKLMIDMAHIAGLVAAGVHPSPVPYADFVTSTTHKTLRGPRGGLILAKEKFGKSLDSKIFPGIQGGPLVHVIAAKAVGFKEAMTVHFREYQEQVVKNASVLSDRLTKHGFRIVSGGTDNHLLLVDLKNKEITGKEAEKLLEQAGFTVNKNAIPFDTESRFVTGGIRIGTPSVTTRGLKEQEMEQIGDWINRVLSNRDDEEIAQVRHEVQELCDRYPLYAELARK